MGFLDRFRKAKKKAEEKIKRPPRGALKRVEPAQKPAVIEADKKPIVKSEAKPEAKPAAKERKSELASLVILSPHVTEKSNLLSEKGIYTFRVSPRANKVMIKQAIRELYGFEPTRIRILNMPSKSRFIRGKPGVKPGYKKAIVSLKEGDKIEIT